MPIRVASDAFLVDFSIPESTVSPLKEAAPLLSLLGTQLQRL